MSLPADILNASPHPIWDSRRLWSLWEMINFGLGTFLQGLSFLDHELRLANWAADKEDGVVDGAQHSRIKSNIKFVMRECCARLLLDETEHTCIKLEELFGRYNYHVYKYSELASLLQRLRADIERGASQEYFFHYPKNLAPLARAGIGGLGGPYGEWKAIVVAFPSAEREITAAVDCFAMDDHPGCVFHMMRVAELGLRTIAKERGVRSLAGKRGNTKPIEWGTWQEVFDAIETHVAVVRRASPGPKRDAALAFYETALSDLRTMRDLYRDPTMHFRETYDPGQAASAMFRAKELMQTLATKLSEANRRRIRWGL